MTRKAKGNGHERLAAIRAELYAIAQDATDTAIYRAGGNVGAVRSRLLEQVRKLDDYLRGDEAPPPDVGESPTP